MYFEKAILQNIQIMFLHPPHHLPSLLTCHKTIILSQYLKKKCLNGFTVTGRVKNYIDVANPLLCMMDGLPLPLCPCYKHILMQHSDLWVESVRRLKGPALGNTPTASV